MENVSSGESQRQTIKRLNDLIELCFDSIKGYEEAAKETREGAFASMFRNRVQQRRELASELQEQVRRLGGDPADSGTVMGAAHRVLLDIRNALMRGDQAVVEEVERGEDTFRDRFRDALADDEIEASTREFLEERFQQVQAAHDEISHLKHSGAARGDTRMTTPPS